MEHVRLGSYVYEVVPQKRGRLKRQLGKVFEQLAETDASTNIIEILGDRAYDVFSVLIGSPLMEKWEWDGYVSKSAFDRAEEARLEVDRLEREIGALPAPAINDEARAAMQQSGTPIRTAEQEQLAQELAGKLVEAREAFDRYEDEGYDEGADRSPDHDEIITAFQVLMRLNRFDVLKGLGKIVDPTVLQGFVTNQLVAVMEGGSPTPSLPTSSAPHPAAATPSTTSTMPPRTSENGTAAPASAASPSPA